MKYKDIQAYMATFLALSSPLLLHFPAMQPYGGPCVHYLLCPQPLHIVFKVLSLFTVTLALRKQCPYHTTCWTSFRKSLWMSRFRNQEKHRSLCHHFKKYFSLGNSQNSFTCGVKAIVSQLEASQNANAFKIYRNKFINPKFFN